MLKSRHELRALTLDEHECKVRHERWAAKMEKTLKAKVNTHELPDSWKSEPVGSTNFSFSSYIRIQFIIWNI